MKQVVFVACLVPVTLLIYRYFAGRLGANPISVITNETGSWTLRFLLITLVFTPLRQLFKWNDAIRFRKMVGLFAFFYGFLHFTTYIWLDQFFDLNSILQDVTKRRFITAGFLAFVLMIPLAITSTTTAIRKLGKKWAKLHQLVYVSALSGVVHYYWLVKKDKLKPIIYASILAALLMYRYIRYLQRVRQLKTK